MVSFKAYLGHCSQATYPSILQINSASIHGRGTEAPNSGLRLKQKSAPISLHAPGDWFLLWHDLPPNAAGGRSLWWYASQQMPPMGCPYPRWHASVQQTAQLLLILIVGYWKVALEACYDLRQGQGTPTAFLYFREAVSTGRVYIIPTLLGQPSKGNPNNNDMAYLRSV